MTRQEFIDTIENFDALKSICWDYDCYICEYVMDADGYHDWVWDSIRDWDSGWRELRDWLTSLPEVYWGDYVDTEDDVGVLDDDDFCDYKNRVFDWFVENDCFDEEENAAYEEENDGCFYVLDYERSVPKPVPESDEDLICLISAS